MSVPLFILLAAVAFSAAGCHRSGEVRAPAAPEAAVPVHVIELAPERLARMHAVVGTFESKRRTTVEAKISGRIEEMPVQLGQAIKAGGLIAKLDASDSQARLEHALATRDQAELDLRRTVALHAQNAATTAELDSAKTRKRISEAAVQEAETMLGDAELNASFDGVIIRKWADVGDMAAGGKPLVEIEDPTSLRFAAQVPSSVVEQIKTGMALPIRLVDSSREIVGTVAQISPASDPLARTARVELDVNDATLRSGVFGRLLIPGRESSFLVIPESAILHRGQVDLAYVVKDGRAELRLVKLGGRLGSGLELLSGVDPHENLVASAPERLHDGQPVSVE